MHLPRVLTFDLLLDIIDDVGGPHIRAQVTHGQGDVEVRLRVAWWRRPWYGKAERERIVDVLRGAVEPWVPVGTHLTIRWA